MFFLLAIKDTPGDIGASLRVQSVTHAWWRIVSASPDESTKVKRCSHAAGPAKDTSCHSGSVQFQRRDPIWNDTCRNYLVAAL